MREFAQVFHISAIIELIENDDLCVVAFTKAERGTRSSQFCPCTPREKERKKERKQIKSNLINRLFVWCDAVHRKEKEGKIASIIRLHHSLNDTKTHLAVRVLLCEENGHVGGDKASPAGD